MGWTDSTVLHGPFSPLFHFLCYTFCSHWVHIHPMLKCELIPRSRSVFSKLRAAMRTAAAVGPGAFSFLIEVFLVLEVTNAKVILVQNRMKGLSQIHHTKVHVLRCVHLWVVKFLISLMKVGQTAGANTRGSATTKSATFTQLLTQKS